MIQQPKPEHGYLTKEDVSKCKRCRYTHQSLFVHAEDYDKLAEEYCKLKEKWNIVTENEKLRRK